MSKQPKPPRKMNGFDGPDWFEGAGMGHYVYTKGEGPAVVVMHELPGLTTFCRDLCNTIADAGFKVYVPLLFGKPEERSIFGNLARVCVSKEFKLFAADERSPAADYARALCQHAHEECGGPGVGLIGMCLTGNFALSLVADPSILAPVAAQPSLPFSGKTALHMSAAQLADAKRVVAERGPSALLGIKYSGDPMCPNARFVRLTEEFGDGFEPIYLEGKKHATLTEHVDQGALDRTLSFLTEKLVA